MDPDLEKLERNFTTRIDQWKSKQGLIFQLRHSYGSSSIVSSLIGVLFRIGVVLLIGVLIFWFYLRSRPNTEAYQLDLRKQIKVGMNASSADMKSVSRASSTSAELQLTSVSLSSSGKSFYEDWYTAEKTKDDEGKEIHENVKNELSISNVRVKPLGIRDNFMDNGWGAKKFELLGLNCHLKAGGETDELAMESYLSLFKNYSSLKVDGVSISGANIGWGYDVGKGSITGADIEASRDNDVWEINVSGGKFSHGWIQDADIKDMKIECHKNGLVKIVIANLRKGTGTISFSADIQIKSQPEVSGTLAFEGVETLDMVGDEYSGWLDGQLKGEGTLSGALNSTSGVISKLKIELDAPPVPPLDPTALTQTHKISQDDSFLIVRGKFPLLQAMQRINGVNSYNLLRLNIGSFELEQNGGDTKITNIDVRADDFLLIHGDLDYVWSSVREKKAQEKVSDTELGSLLYEEDDPSKNGENPDKDLAGGRGLGERDVKLFSGELNMGFVPQVFDAYPAILNVYPEDPSTIRVWIPVKMRGELSEATSNIADKLEKIVREEHRKSENK